MLVIIYLLEDEQELSLGMLIRPKRIYNFCLLHACFGWYCYAFDTLSYTFDHIWTNLLTQCTSVPVPVFCCLFVPGFPHIKIARKIQEKSYKKLALRKLRESPKEDLGGPTCCPGGQGARPPLGRAGGAPGSLVAPLAAPLRLYILRDAKTLKTEPFFMISPLFRRHSAPKIGSIRRLLPGTLPEGGITSGSFSIAMDASRMSRE